MLFERLVGKDVVSWVRVGVFSLVWISDFLFVLFRNGVGGESEE